MNKKTIIFVSFIFIIIFAINNSVYHAKFLYFNILLVLSLALFIMYAFYKKEPEKSKIIDIVFLAIFFSSLIVPVLYISNNETTEIENRTLATYRPLFLANSKINYGFTQNFDAWVKDQFYLKNEFIYAYNRNIKGMNDIIVDEDHTYNKKTKRMFQSYHGFNYKFGDDLYIVVMKYLNQLYKFCKENNIKLYILIAPTTDEILYDKLYPYNLKNYTIEHYEFMKRIQKYSKAPVIYPYEEFFRECNDTIHCFFKTDYHWTEYGAYVGYKALIRRIQQDYPNVKIVPENEYNTFTSKKIRSDFKRIFYRGNIFYNIFPYYKKEMDEILDTDYLYYINKNEKLLEVETINIPFKKQKTLYYPKGADLRVLQIGTSANESLVEFIPYTFKNVKYIRINDVERVKKDDEFKILENYKTEILNYKPDIMIFCILSGNFGQIEKLLNED